MSLCMYNGNVKYNVNVDDRCKIYVYFSEKWKFINVNLYMHACMQASQMGAPEGNGEIKG